MKATCPDCKGTGRVERPFPIGGKMIESACPKCSGTGQIEQAEPPAKVYRGYRLQQRGSVDGEPTTQHCVVTVQAGDGGPGDDQSDLPLRLDLRNHSPTGFEWGYGGSGPAQLALALVADACGDRYAVAPIYQRVKAKLVAALPHDGWTLTQATVKETVEEIMRDCEHARDAAELEGGAL